MRPSPEIKSRVAIEPEISTAIRISRDTAFFSTGSPTSEGRASAARQRSQTVASRQSARRGRIAATPPAIPPSAVSASCRKNGNRTATSPFRHGGTSFQTRSGSGASRKAQGNANSDMVSLHPPLCKSKEMLDFRRIQRVKRRWRDIGRIGKPASGAGDKATSCAGIGTRAVKK